MTNALCKCGRPSTKVHCPQCGRTSRVYCYAPTKRLDTITRGDGSIVQLRVYRCQVCGTIFNDDDWQLRCIAPAVNNATTFVGKLTDAVKQLEVSKIIQEQFGGDATAYRHSLFAKGQGPRQEKPLEHTIAPLSDRSTSASTGAASSSDMSDNEVQQLLREIDEGLK